MLAYVEVYFAPTIYCKVEGGFPFLRQECIDEVWWLRGMYAEVMEESEADNFRKRIADKIKSEADKYHVGDLCPFGSFVVSRTFVEKPEIRPNFKRMEIKLLKDMPTEEVLKIATIPQILQEFGELKIK